jgi:hypothetical protein
VENIFLKQKFKEFNLELNRSEATIYKTTINNKEQELYITSINLDTERSIKIPKQELEEIKDHLRVVLVLIIENEPRGLYIIPSKIFLKPDNYIFTDNEMIFKSLSNYEIKIFTNAFEELSQYSIKNMIKYLIF